MKVSSRKDNLQISLWTFPGFAAKGLLMDPSSIFSRLFNRKDVRLIILSEFKWGSVWPTLGIWITLAVRQPFAMLFRAKLTLKGIIFCSTSCSRAENTPSSPGDLWEWRNFIASFIDLSIIFELSGFFNDLSFWIDLLDRILWVRAPLDVDDKFSQNHFHNSLLLVGCIYCN